MIFMSLRPVQFFGMHLSIGGYWLRDTNAGPKKIRLNEFDTRSAKREVNTAVTDPHISQSDLFVLRFSARVPFAICLDRHRQRPPRGGSFDLDSR